MSALELVTPAGPEAVTDAQLRQQMSGLLNDTELRLRLGISHRTFYRRKKEGKFKSLEIARPMGNKRYSKVLVERLLAGESPAVMGGRRR